MSKTPLKNPRASFWRDQKVAEADKIPARRALEHEIGADDAKTPHPVRQRTAARVFWKPPHPWAEDNAA